MAFLMSNQQHQNIEGNKTVQCYQYSKDFLSNTDQITDILKGNYSNLLLVSFCTAPNLQSSWGLVSFVPSIYPTQQTATHIIYRYVTAIGQYEPLLTESNLINTVHSHESKMEK